MTKSVLERYEDAHAAFMGGDVENAPDEQLLAYLSGLSNQNNTNTGTQHRDIIRGLTINNILLKRHLDGLQRHITLLNRQNSQTQKVVIALTIASLLGTAAQIWYAYRADANADRGTVAAAPVEKEEAAIAIAPSRSAVAVAPMVASAPIAKPSASASGGAASNPSIDRTSSGRLRVPTDAAHGER